MTTTHRISIGVALALALGASAAPAVSAHPAQASRVVRSNPDDQIAAVTQAPPAGYSRQDKATVSPQSAVSQPTGVYNRQDKSLPPQTSPSSSGPATAPSLSSPQPLVRVVTPDNGFDWADAGIGAAGGLALSMIGLGGALAVSQRRTRRARESTALTS